MLDIARSPHGQAHVFLARSGRVLVRGRGSRPRTSVEARDSEAGASRLEDRVTAARVADIERLLHPVLLADAAQLIVGGPVVLLDRLSDAVAHGEQAGVIAGGEPAGGLRNEAGI